MSRADKKVFQKKLEAGVMDGVPFLGLLWVIVKGIKSMLTR